MSAEQMNVWTETAKGRRAAKALELWTGLAIPFCRSCSAFIDILAVNFLDLHVHSWEIGRWT